MLLTLGGTYGCDRQSDWVLILESSAARARAASGVGDVHHGTASVVPASVDRPFDLRRQLQQQPVVGLAGLGLDAQRHAILLGAQWQRDGPDAAQIGQRPVGGLA